MALLLVAIKKEIPPPSGAKETGLNTSFWLRFFYLYFLVGFSVIF